MFNLLDSLFSQFLSVSFSAPVLLLLLMLRHGVLSEGAVFLSHAKSGTSTAGDTGEALAAVETKDRHGAKANAPLFFLTLRPLQDGLN